MIKITQKYNNFIKQGTIIGYSDYQLQRHVINKNNMKIFKMVRGEKAEEFICSRCNKQKKAKNIAHNIDNNEELLCNGCFGLLLSKQEIKKG